MGLAFFCAYSWPLNCRRYFIFLVTFLQKISIGFLAILLMAGGLPGAAHAAPGVPDIISYQGRLTNSNGQLLGGNGTTYYFRFSIWDSPTVATGSKLWPSSNPGTTPLSVDDGVFNVNIGDTANGYPDALTYNFQDNSAVYLQVEVSSDNSTFETLGPRQRITSTGSAINAATLAGLTPGTGANNLLQLGSSGEISILGAINGITVSSGTITSGTWNGAAIGAQYGGTGLSSYTAGDLLYASTANTLAALPIGGAGKVLTSDGSTLSWQDIPSTSGPGAITVAVGSSGTDFNVSGSPVSSGGTVTINIPSASATKRGLLTAADWAAFNAKQDALVFNGPLSDTSGTVSIANAAADGSTKGAAAFAANDFDATGGVVSIDYSNAQSADATHKGFLTAADYATFAAKQNAITTGTSGQYLRGDLTLATFPTAVSAFGNDAGYITLASLSGSGPVGYDPATGTISVAQAGASTSGYLSTSDWNTFNGKQAAGAYITGLTGDATASGPGIATFTLASVNAAIGTFGDSTHTGTFTVNGKGLITSATSTPISFPVTSVNGATGAVALTTTSIPQGTNLYYTDARARASISGTSPVSYDQTTGVISLAKADGSTDGYLSSTDWNTFNGKQNAITTGTSGQYLRGDLTLATFPTAVSAFSNDAHYITLSSVSGAAPLAYDASTGIFSITKAGTATDGYLSSTDWNTFNGKQAAGNYITGLTGDGTASGAGSDTFTLSTVNSTTGTYGDGTHVGTFTVNAKGLVTAASSTPISFPITSVNGGTGAVTLAVSNTGSTLGWVGTQLNIPTSTATTTGLLSSTDWNTFNGKQNAITTGTTAQYVRGDLSLATFPTTVSTFTNDSGYTTLGSFSATSPLAYSSSTGVFSMPKATGSANGYLASADWTTFNGKQAALSGTGIVESNAGTISYITGTSGQFVKADGSLDSSTYLTASTGVASFNGRVGTVVPTSGDYTSDMVTQGTTNLYFSNALAIGSTLTGYASGAGTVSSSDSVLSAIQKLNGNQGLYLPLAGGTMTGQIGWASGLGAITQLQGPADQAFALASASGAVGTTTGGAGQSLNLITGAGGAASSGTGGNSGSLNFTIAAPGTGTSSAGSSGSFNFSGGNVGIGTTTPAASLTLYKAAPELRIQTTGDNNYGSLTRSSTSDTLSVTNQVVTHAGGSGLTFNGTNSYASVPNYLGSMNTFSVAMWVKYAASQNTKTIFSNYGKASKGWVVGVDDAGSNKIKFFLGGATLLSATALTPGTWYHVVVTYNNGNPTIYINGAQDSTSASTITFDATYYGNDIGRLGNGTQYFNGSLDDLRVYNRALSLSDVQAIYNGGAGTQSGTSSGEIAHYLMDEGSGSFTADTAGTNTATLVSTTWSTGAVASSISTGTAAVITSEDGLAAGENGITQFGDPAGGTQLQGQTLKLFTAGSERLRIDNYGNVGIGTTTPTALLSVGSTSQFQVSSTGQETWGTGLGAITQILGPTDQALTIKSGSPASGNAQSLFFTAGSASLANGVGGSVTISSGAGIGGGASGTSNSGSTTITAASGSGSSSSAAGAVNITGAAINSASSGGAVNITTPNGSSNGSQSIGAINITTGTGSASSGGLPSIPGGNIVVTTGGSTAPSASYTGTAGTVGGSLTTILGAGSPGGNAGVQTTFTGGTGGAYGITLGAGGASAASVAATGGTGSPFTETGGVGGAATGAGVNIGGAGSSFTLTSGAGGAASGGTSNTGGASGSLTLQIGAVGTGATANGAGGFINFSNSSQTMAAFSSTGQLAWKSGLGAITQLMGPSDQTFIISAGTPVAAAGVGLTLTASASTSAGAAAGGSTIVTSGSATGSAGGSVSGSTTLTASGGTGSAASTAGAVNITGSPSVGASGSGIVNITTASNTSGSFSGVGALNITSGTAVYSGNTSPITGGALNLTTGGGGVASTAATTSGNGGTLGITLGAGSAFLASTGVNETAGNGGAFTISGGVGGAATNGTAVNVGGNGSSLTFTSGNGGNASGGSSNTGGNSGSLNFAIGTPGTGATAAGATGTFNFTGGGIKESVLGGTGSAGITPFTVDNTASGATYINNSFLSASNMTAGEVVTESMGKAASNYNLGYMGFKYAGSGLTSNTLTWGFYNADQLMSLDGTGALSVKATQGLNATALNISTGAGYGVGNGTGIDFRDSTGETGHIQDSYDGTYTDLNFGGLYNSATYNTTSNQMMTLQGSGNLGIGTTTPTGLFQVAQVTTGVGKISNAASGTTVTGVGTQFLNTFKVGDSITANGETHAISAIASNTSMTTAAWTAANASVAYTLTGRTPFTVLGNGNIGIGTVSPTSVLTLIGDTSSTAVGPLVVKGSGNSTLGVALTLDSTTDGSGKAFSFLSTGSGAAPGSGKFAVYDSTDSRYVFTTDASGQYIAGIFTSSGLASAGQITSYPNSASTVGLAIVGAVSQSANYLNVTSNGSTAGNIFNVQSNGRVGVATTSPSALFSVGSTSQFQVDTTGDITASGITASGAITFSGITSGTACNSAGTAVGYTSAGLLLCNTSVSDERLKTDITDLDTTTGLAAIEKLNPVSYYWKDTNLPGTGSTAEQFGFIAQDVQGVLPNLVTTNAPTYLTPDVTYGLNYQGFTAVMVQAIKELDVKVEPLTSLDPDQDGSLASLIGKYLGDAGNKLTKIFSGEVDTNKLCIGQTCLNEAQVQQILQVIQTQGVPAVPAAPSSNTGGDSSGSDSTASAPAVTPDDTTVSAPVDATDSDTTASSAAVTPAVTPDDTTATLPAVSAPDATVSAPTDASAQASQ